MFLFFLVVANSGCMAIHSGIMNNSASLSSANFSYVKRGIYGSSKVEYFLGIGGLDRTSLVIAAKEDMLNKYPLKSNQALANIVVSFKNSNYLFLYKNVTCYISADLVEFVSNNSVPESTKTPEDFKTKVEHKQINPYLE